MKTKDILKLFKPLFPDDWDKEDNQASYLLEIFDDIESFGDEDSKLKNLGYKLIKIDRENGEYYESEHHYIFLKEIKTKKAFRFQIYDNGAIASDAIEIVEDSWTEVKPKKRIVYE